MSEVHVRPHTRGKPAKPDPEDGKGMEIGQEAPKEGPGIVKREDNPGPQREQRKGQRGAEIVGGGNRKPQEGVTIIRGKK